MKKHSSDREMMRKMAKVTIRNIADHCGVSIATVSRVLNNNDKVDKALAAKVLSAARELGYRPGMAGAPIGPRSSEKTGMIAFVVPALENTYFSSVTAGLLDAAAETHQQVVMMKTDSDVAQEDAYISRLLTLPLDGIIFASSNGRDPAERFPELKDRPFVVAARRHLTDGVPHVYADNENAGYLATKYLLRLNHRHIAFFANSWGHCISNYDEFLEQLNSKNAGGFTAIDRYLGYRRALDEEGIEFDPRLIIFSGYGFEDGYNDAQQLLGSAVDFDSILASNDRVAAGIVKLLNEQGIKIPERVSLICLNSGLIAQVSTPAFTVIEQDNYRLGAESLIQLNKLIKGEPAGDVCLDVRLQIRGSTMVRSDSE